MKICTESGHCPDNNLVCENFENEPDEIGERGQILGTGYCVTCGHQRECHEDLTKEQVALFGLDEPSESQEWKDFDPDC